MIEFGSENKEIGRTAPFVLSINDNDDNELRIIIALTKMEEMGEDLDMNDFPGNDSPRVREMLEQSYPIYKDMENVYEILFEKYIFYQCRNESYTSYDDYEIRKGRYFIILTRSRLLDYYKNVIFDFDYEETKNTRKQYGIYTQNHIIDVISNEPPIIKKYEQIPIDT